MTVFVPRSIAEAAHRVRAAIAIAVGLGTTHCGGPAPARGPVAISDRPGDPKIAGCLRGENNPPVFKDSEPYAAVDPRDERHLLAGWQTTNPAGSVIATSVSFDGGRTWSPPLAAPINSCASGPVPDAERASDPWVAIGRDGRAYVGGIGFRVGKPGTRDDVNALVVASSDDGGRTWSAGTVVARGGAGVTHDNLALTADPLAPRTVYLTTTRYAPGDSGRPGYGPIGFSRSDDGGASWSPLRPISPNVAGGRVSAPAIVADPRNGKLRAIYFRSGDGVELIGAIESTDRGASWSDEIKVASYRHAEWTPPSPVDGKPFVLAGDVAQAAIDPSSGAIYVAYPNGRGAGDQRMAVDLVWSADGRTWSPPIAVSDSGREQAWLPGVAVARNGDVGVSYVTARLDVRDSTLVPMTVRLRRFRLTKGELQPTDATIVDQANFAWPGDYGALLALADGFHAVYGRSTRGPAERFERPPVAAFTANPTDIYFR